MFCVYMLCSSILSPKSLVAMRIWAGETLNDAMCRASHGHGAKAN